MIEVAGFSEKLNKVEGKVYVIEEEIRMPESGVYEALLEHDNIAVSTLTVYTGPKLTGDRIQSYVLSTPTLTPWKRQIRIQTEEPVVYIAYETEGDTVEAEDVNRLQGAVVQTQQALNAEETRALQAEEQMSIVLENHLEDTQNPHGVTAAQLGLGNVENKSASDILSELTAEDVTAALGYTPADDSGSMELPDTGVEAGTYTKVTVDGKGRVMAGESPSALEGYGITDALKKGAITRADLGGG